MKQIPTVLAALCVILGTAPSLAAQAARTDTATARPRAIDHSSAYYTRLSIHRAGSYAILPLFAGEYLLGNHLLDNNNAAGWVKGAHSATAFAIGTIFAVNTVTGLWNLVEARHDPNGARRWLHAGLMLASEAGFVYVASLGGKAGDTHSDGARHRNAALVSIGISTVGTVMMWLWKGGDE